jgi:hypothetical protein
MPSDPRVDAAVEAVRDRWETHRSAVVSTVEELRGVLNSGGGGAAPADPGERLARALGPFAAGRMNAGALATLVGSGEELEGGVRAVLERALGILEARSAEGPDRAVTRVPLGEDLRDGVRDALARAGVAFGVARAVERARTGRFRPGDDDELLTRWPPRRWSRAERAMAPPLVVSVEGADLRPAGLADMLAGNQALVLVVDGPAPPAALARLVTPGSVVIQTTDFSSLELLAQRPGPAVAAVFEDGAEGVVPFVHDPRGGMDSRDRIRLGVDRDALRADLGQGRWRDGRYSEDVALLLSLTVPAAPGTAPAPGNTPGKTPGTFSGAGEVTASPSGDPAADVDRLAAWLLAQSDLAGVEEEA